MSEFDEAAEVAEKEYREEIIENGSAEDVAHWWKKHYLKAGHKRLGRILVKIAKET